MYMSLKLINGIWVLMETTIAHGTSTIEVSWVIVHGSNTIGAQIKSVRVNTYHHILPIHMYTAQECWVSVTAVLFHGQLCIIFSSLSLRPR